MNSRKKSCPECGHVFQGGTWGGIDAHWKSRHDSIMPYHEAWPLIKAGTYKTDRANNPPPQAITQKPVPKLGTDLLKTCPECGHAFQGSRWEGIDAHWKSKHDHLMPYEKAWPLIRDGLYKTT